VEVELDPAAGHGLCDANQLENAVLNLAINARDAMPDGGTLSISTSLVRRGEEPGELEGDFVRISVTDTGEGMSPDVLARATEPFYSTKPVGKGTGLGLAQVYGIVDQSGGTLRIASREGEGTRVDIYLPAVEAPAQEAPRGRADRALAARHETATVLVVDDDQDVREFLAHSLEGLGHKVLAAAGGEEALLLLQGNQPDLALIDYAMPGMHGADVARAMRAQIPGLPIVFVTGYAETGQLEAAIGPEAPVLRKPFTIDDLSDAVAANLAP
jgi:CheY-like chemotaxis protein